jgi:hypothetical protein
MKKGDKVYRVCPAFEIPGMGFHLQARTLVVYSDKQLRLDSHFDGGANLIYQPSDLGRVFHATAGEAVEAYERGALSRVEGAKAALTNAKSRADSATAWSADWRKSHCGRCGGSALVSGKDRKGEHERICAACEIPMSRPE